MLVYPSGVDVSSSALRFLSTRLRQHRRAIGSHWRRLSSGRQALLTLAHLGVGHTYAGADLMRVPRWGDSQRFGMWLVVPAFTVAGVEPAVRGAGAERGWVWCAVVDGGVGGQAG
ncbi:hypothetical protein GCM10020367_65480 [Streptomyces sannanensis]|uniref:Uncharacterized protein n=1 Tax=Streptomyces sannanensis TaxID=285536 RepID=A0ABP6SM73_9ACTN